MNGVGDSQATFDIGFEKIDKSPGKKNKDQEIQILKKQYKRNLLTNAQKSFIFFERQSLVNYIETDGEYIISAGRDHDINVWDAIEGRHIRRLFGHTAPVTGLHLHAEQEEPLEKIIISTSEDGTIKKWSLNKGEELKSFETDNVITSMGIINRILVVTGNHKGYIEVRHLDMGELYSSILAHEDPIDALVVKGKYACSAIFEVPSCLKVWEIQFEQTTCIYRIENSPDIVFSSLAMWNTTAILGASDARKLHVIDFKTNARGIIDLGSRGSIQHVRVCKEWILSYSHHKEDVVLDVHRIHNYEHFGTFKCNMQQVSATAAIESDSSFKIIIGGSALAILSFDFILTQDAKATSQRSIQSERPICVQNRNRSHYTLKGLVADEDREESSNSEGENSSENKTYNHYKNVISQLKSEYDEIYPRLLHKEEDVETLIRPDQSQMSNSVRSILTRSIMPQNMKDGQLFMPDKIELEEMLQSQTEPRVAVRKLEEYLDGNKKLDFKNCMRNSENYEALKEARSIFTKEYDEKQFEETFNEMNRITNMRTAEREENKAETDETNTAELVTESTLLLNEIKMNSNILDTENEGCKNETPKENKNSKKSKFCPKKKEKGKTDKKKSSEKTKNKRCIIM